MSFTIIRPLILTKLQGVSQIQFADDKHSSNLTGFPAATFEPSGSENIYLTNAENQRRYAFDIILHQEITKAGRDEAVRILAAAVDAVITAFDTDYRLTNNVDFCMAIPSKWGEYPSGSGSIMYAMMTLVCVKSAIVIT